MLTLRKLRLSRGLSQKEVADAIGVSQNAVSQWESGNRTPTLDLIIQLADLLKCTTDDLLDKQAEPNNLLKLRKKKGVTQKEVAEAIGITPVQYGYMESGKRNITPKNLMLLATYFNVTTDKILSIEDDENPGWLEIQEKPVPVFTESVFMVPLVATLRCGYDAAGKRIYDVLKEIELPTSYRTRYGEDIVLIKAIGESMLPSIRPRDMLICKPGDAWEDGTVVVINLDDSDTIKRIYRAEDGGIDLIPDNPDFKIKHMSPDDIQDLNPHVLGRIVRNMGQDM